MTKGEFLQALRRELHGLPEKDIRDSLEYYVEMIDDRVESGVPEQVAIKRLGEPKEIAMEIMLDLPLPKLLKQKYNKKSGWKTWEIVLLVLGFPLWFPLLVTAAALALTLYVVLWSVLITLWTVDLAFAASGVALLAVAVPQLFLHPANALFNFGAALVLIGLTFPLFFGCLKLTKPFCKLSVALTKKIKSIIIGRK